jgi:glycerol-3-phosphate dehydrogenase (NAD(P)+)
MKIVICGGTGSFGTALGNVLSLNDENEVILLGRDKMVVDGINKLKINPKHFPNIKLNDKLKATTNIKVLSDADMVFLSLPSSVVVDYVERNKKLINKDSIIVNLAKGFGKNGDIIPSNLKEICSNKIVSLKGPTFASELIHNYPSAFTIGSENKETFKLFKEIFKDTNVCLDYSTDIKGVELTSILKNIYAICLGIVDAYFNSANTRFLVLTKAFNEMREILIYLGGKGETLFKYCGFGDFGLTALNDLSRNRTLGLMIGKGFLSPNTESSVILEGKRSLKVIYNKIKSENFLIVNSLYEIFYKNESVTYFLNNILF